MIGWLYRKIVGQFSQGYWVYASSEGREVEYGFSTYADMLDFLDRCETLKLPEKNK